MGGWVDGHFDIFFDILLKPPQPFTGLFLFVLQARVRSCNKQKFDLSMEAFPFHDYVGGIPIEAWLIEQYVHSHGCCRWFRFTH